LGIKLVLTKEKPTPFVDQDIRGILNTSAASEFYDGESTGRIREKLLKENADDCVIVTADSRLLKFVHDIFLLEDVYIFNDNKLNKLSQLTPRQLRPSHNLMNLYEAGEFYAN
jgi:hypothetical protein